MRALVARVAVVFALALAAPAQNTWIVDANNGAGTNFTDLPPAVAQVAAGDLLIVRAGLYTGFSTGKPLRVIGEGGVVVQRLSLLPPWPPVIEIRGLPVGSTFTLKNLTIQPQNFNGSAITLASNAGSVHIEDVHTDTFPALYGVTGMIAVQCNAVTVTGGILEGWPAVNVGQSLLVLVGARVRGFDGSQSPRNPQFATFGIFAADTTLLLSRSDVQGGNGSAIFPFPASAIVANNTELSITGDGSTSVLAGVAWGTPVATAGIQADGGSVTFDPQVTIAGSGGGPPIAGTATVRSQRVASLTADGAPLGGTVSVELVSPAGDPIVIAVALPAPPLPLLGGYWFLDLPSLISLVVGTQNGTERTQKSFVVPAIPALRGHALALQAVHYHTARSFLELTAPAVVVVD